MPGGPGLPNMTNDPMVNIVSNSLNFQRRLCKYNHPPNQPNPNNIKILFIMFFIFSFASKKPVQPPHYRV